VARAAIRDWLCPLERAEPEEQWAVLCFLAGRHVRLDPEARNAAVRRAQLLLVAGGDPRRRLALYGRAVSALAEDLDTPAARHELAQGLDDLVDDVAGLRGATESLQLLRNDPDLAWQAFALSVIADELSGADAAPGAP
jgi:hypothetical protein